MRKVRKDKGQQRLTHKPRVRGSAKVRFLKYVQVDKDDCWRWQAQIMPNGYGRFYLQDRQVYAHRAAYVLFVGALPKGLDLDHLCRKRDCVNPSHLEPVTRRENLLRGVGFVAINAKREACSRGHLYTPENTHIYKGARICRHCARDKQRLLRKRERC